jgi:hypothetical protein
VTHFYASLCHERRTGEQAIKELSKNAKLVINREHA